MYIHSMNWRLQYLQNRAGAFRQSHVFLSHSLTLVLKAVDPENLCIPSPKGASIGLLARRGRGGNERGEGQGGRQSGNGGRRREKKIDRIMFPNPTYVRPTVPFRFPPFPELPPNTHTHKHAHTHTFTHCEITPDVTSRGSPSSFGT